LLDSKSLDRYYCCSYHLLFNTLTGSVSQASRAFVQRCLATSLLHHTIHMLTPVCAQIKTLEHVRGVSFLAKDKEGFNVAIWAAKRQQIQVLRYLIEHHPESLKATDLDGTTVLGFAFIDNNKRSLHTIHTLLDSGLMDLEQQENNGSTALFRAAATGFTQGAKILVDSGAKVDATNSNGYTSLHLAAGVSASPEMVRYLLDEGGANLNIRNTKGLTPLDYAKTRNEVPESSKELKEEIIKELERKTAQK